MVSQPDMRAPRAVNHINLETCALDVERAVIVLDTAQESLFNGTLPATQDGWMSYLDRVDAYLAVVTEHLRALAAEMRGAEAS